MPEQAQETESGPGVSGRPIFGRFVAYTYYTTLSEAIKPPRTTTETNVYVHPTVELIRFRRVLVHCCPSSLSN